MRISVIGSGSWGTALAQVLADNHHDVMIWGRNPDEILDINENHRNHNYFGDTALNPSLKATADFETAALADIILLAVPTAAVEEVALRLNDTLNHPVIVINVAKGFHPVTHDLLSDVIEKSMSPDTLTSVVSLIGPSHAEEVVLRKLTTINSVSKDESAATLIQDLFSNQYFRVYRNLDTIGAQIGVAIKNVISLASGVAAGLDLGDNARAALITRGLAEIMRYGIVFGAKPETFLGLCGVGDLVVTCTSPHSRNFQAGYEIGKHNDASHFMATNTKTVEGIFATKAVYEVSVEKGIEMPITQQVYKVLYEGKIPSQAIKELMLRDLKSEFVG